MRLERAMLLSATHYKHKMQVKSESQVKINALLEQLTNLPDNEKVDVLKELVGYYKYSNIAEAQRHAKTGVVLSRRFMRKEATGFFLNLLGSIAYRKGRFHKALLLHSQAYDIFDSLKNAKGKAKCLLNAGNVYLEKGLIIKALESYQKSSTIYKECNDEEGYFSSVNNQGAVYFHLGQYDRALKSFEEALQHDLASPGRKGEAIRYNNIGEIYKKQKKYDQSILFLEKSLEIKSELGFDSDLINAYNNLGEAYALKGNSKIAMDLYAKAEAMAEQAGVIPMQIDNMHKRVRLLNQNGNYYTAKTILLKANHLARLNEHKIFEIDSCHLLAQVFASLKEFERSTHYYQQYIALKEDVFDKEKLKSTDDLRTKHEIESMGKELEELKEQQNLLEKINQDLELFAGRVAHDFKEPLRMIGSFTGILEERYKTLIKGEDKEFFLYIKRGVNQLTLLLEDMLQFARTGLTNPISERISLNEILEKIKNLLRLKIEEKNVDIIAEQLPSVMASETLVVVVFQNLISNAIKFCDKEQPVIRITSKLDEEFYKIGISDNGIGIRPEKLASIFDVFVRLHGRDEYEGSGIGLATCKKAVEQLNGKIWVESKVNEGSTFWVMLPAF